MAMLLAKEEHDVVLWSRDDADALQTARENRRYLPGHRFPDALAISNEAPAAVRERELVLLALPSSSVREVTTLVAPHLAPGAILLCASKGLEARSRATLDRVIREVTPAPVVLLSGPTFAAEIAAGLPAAAVAASDDAGAAESVQQTFSRSRLRVYTTEDVAGVAVGGALKNVIAIAAGCSDGLGFGHNARAALITRGLHEIGRLAAHLGGNPLTLAGLAGLGDLVLTCTGELSRNRRVGLALGAGEPLSAITARLGQVAEGIETARLAHELAEDLYIDMPITAQVAAIVTGQRSPREAVAALMGREQGKERG